MSPGVLETIHLVPEAPPLKSCADPVLSNGSTFGISETERIAVRLCTSEKAVKAADQRVLLQTPTAPRSRRSLRYRETFAEQLDDAIWRGVIEKLL
jgi:hypothetical protein